MRLWFAKASRNGSVGLIPTDDESRHAVEKMGAGECAEITFSSPRSSQWNRLYWLICREIGRNQDPERDEDSIDAELRILSGHYEIMHVDGHEVRVPKRIAFDRLSAEGWQEYWRKAEQAIITRFGPEYIEEFAA